MRPGAYALYRPSRDRLDSPRDKEILEEAFVWSCLNNSREPVEFLLEEGLNIDATPSVGGCHASGLHRSALAGWIEMVEFLLKRGANLNLRDDVHNSTPLAWAAAAGRREIVEYLAAKGPGELDDALRAAVNRDRPEIVKHLLRCGADPTQQNDAGKSAVDLALKGNNEEIVQLLKESDQNLN